MRSHSVGYRFKGPADFSYLTGLEIPGAVLIVAGSSSYLLQKPSLGPSVWDEENSASSNEISSITFDSTERLEEIIRALLPELDRIAVPVGRSEEVELKLLKLIAYNRRHRSTFAGYPITLCDSRALVGAIRAVKESAELLKMREAGQRSSLVHTAIVRQSLIGKTERTIANEIEAGFLKQGMQWTAYETIVGAGERSTILHARATDRAVKDGDLVLIDAGGEWDGYCADITRTLPAAAKFSPEQRQLYEVVLAAQKAVIAATAPGQTLEALNQLAQTVLADELMRANLVRSPDLSKLMPHSTSHWIGMDVHDPCPYLDEKGDAIKLQPGMCFTVEPGLYFREAGSAYRGWGLRIEDDLAVTENGCELLTNAVREVEEIEALRQG